MYKDREIFNVELELKKHFTLERIKLLEKVLPHAEGKVKVNIERDIAVNVKYLAKLNEIKTI